MSPPLWKQVSGQEGSLDRCVKARSFVTCGLGRAAIVFDAGALARLAVALCSAKPFPPTACDQGPPPVLVRLGLCTLWQANDQGKGRSGVSSAEQTSANTAAQPL